MIHATDPGHPGPEILELASPELVLMNSAPITQWNDIQNGQHIAQFYESDTFLLNSLKGFVSEGLRADSHALDQLRVQRNSERDQAQAMNRP